MQDNESNLSTPLGDCPSNDELAAFLEGRLVEPRLGKVRRHVLDCPVCDEVYADAHRFESEAGQPPGPGVLPFVKPEEARRRRWAVAILPIAAGLVLAAISSYQFVARTVPVRPEPFKPADWTGQLSKESLQSKSRPRGDEGDHSRRNHQVALQGGSLVDLTLALSSGRHSEIDGPLSDLMEAARAVAATEKAGSVLGNLRVRFGAVTDRRLSPQEIEELRDEAEKVLLPFGPDQKLSDLRNLQDFGQWREAARLAAESRDPRFFTSRDNRRFLAWLRGPYWGSPPIPLSRDGQKTLQKIAKVWPDPVTPETTLAYASLEAGFDRLTSPDSLTAP